MQRARHATRDERERAVTNAAGSLLRGVTTRGAGAQLQSQNRQATPRAAPGDVRDSWHGDAVGLAPRLGTSRGSGGSGGRARAARAAATTSLSAASTSRRSSRVPASAAASQPWRGRTGARVRRGVCMCARRHSERLARPRRRGPRRLFLPEVAPQRAFIAVPHPPRRSPAHLGLRRAWWWWRDGPTLRGNQTEAAAFRPT